MCRSRIIIVEGVPSCSSVLIAMFRSKEGFDYVQLSAWHKLSDGSTLFQGEDLEFANDHFAQTFIKNFPVQDAQLWVGSFYENEIIKGEST